MKAVLDARYRWSVASRCVAAAVGGYAVVTLLHVAFMALLPLAPGQGLLLASQTGYLWYTGVILWCFATSTAKRAWLGLAIVAVPLALIDVAYWLHRGMP